MKKLLLILCLLALTAGDFRRDRQGPTLQNKVAGLKPTLWLDSSDVSTITITGSGVSSWCSKYGSICFTQGTDANRPAYTTNINGRHGVTFDGAASTLSTVSTLDDIFNADAKTVFLVMTLSDGDAHRYFGDNASFKWWIQNNGGTLSVFNDDGSQDGATTTIAAGNHIISSTHDGTTLTVNLNGTAGSSSASGNTSSLAGTLTIGDIAGTYHQGEILELITFDKVLTDSDIDTIERLLAKKWGVNLR